MEENNKNNKIVLATRTNCDEFEKCKDCIKKLKSSDADNIIHKFYIVCNLRKEDIRIDKNIEIIPDKDPTRPTAFNLVIDRLKEDERKDGKYHLLTFSKEVELNNNHIKRMIEELNTYPDYLIVVGYRLRDNVLSDEEYKLYSNSMDGNKGIAYQVPWNTCALWNKKFVYGEGKEFLRFDEICEKDKNQLGKLMVKINGKLEETDYEGMEDGLAIAGLVTKNNELEFKLIEEELGWNIKNIGGNEERIKKQKKKMARKNIVLSTFINIKGYSIDAFKRSENVNNKIQKI